MLCFFSNELTVCKAFLSLGSVFNFASAPSYTVCIAGDIDIAGAAGGVGGVTSVVGGVTSAASDVCCPFASVLTVSVASSTLVVVSSIGAAFCLSKWSRNAAIALTR